MLSDGPFLVNPAGPRRRALFMVFRYARRSGHPEPFSSSSYVQEGRNGSVW